VLKAIFFAIMLGIPASAFAGKTELFVKADSCFKSGDYDCAFETTVTLLEAGHLVVGWDDRTTDSMTFFQMSYVEKAARSDLSTKIAMFDRVFPVLGAVQRRLPFVAGFAVLTISDGCRRARLGECESDFADMFCRIDHEIPEPTWRSLHGVPQLSKTGKSYFEGVMLNRPTCGV
jgi:hypothetical protein